MPGMSLMLALETSSRNGSLALSRDGEILAQCGFAHGLQNAAMILPLLDELCRQQNIAPRQLDAVAVSIGPGSFTGLRIGVTLAKTLCFASGAKLLAVPSLRVIAHNAPPDAVHILPLLDAKRDQVFAAVYSRQQGGGLAETIPPQLTSLLELLQSAPRPLCLLGEGLPTHRQHLDSLAGDLPQVLPEALWAPQATTVAMLAWPMYRQGQFADPFRLSPLYIRKPEAQERLEAGLLKHLTGEQP